MDGPATGSLGYRPHLDGVRAVAVYLVVAFHAGIGRAANGFIGVDVFFVLSGYLVTSLLLRDLAGGGGRVRFGRFYARRVRRLLPAAVLTLTVTAVVFGGVAAPVELADARSGIRAAALYVANWHFIRQSNDYFAADITTNPVVHFWSLSVEEQFYLVWPVLLTGIWAITRRVGRHRTRALQGLIAGGAIASALWALHLAGSNLDRAYYGTDTRAYQLLAGALLAVAPGAVRRLRTTGAVAPILGTAMLAALMVLSTGTIDVGPIGRGIAVAAITVTLLAALDASARGPVAAVLRWGPITYLGRISYSTYLWHWLVIVVLAREVDISPIATAAVSAAVATGLASLSYEVLEHPIRTAPTLDRLRPAVIATGLAMSLLVAAVVAPTILDRATGSAARDAAAPAAAVGSATPSAKEVGAAWKDIYDYGTCEVSGPIACPIEPGSPGEQTAIVVGESHAGMLTPMLAELARRHHARLFAGYLSYCPWVRGVKYLRTGRNCFADQADLYDRIIPELDPDIVFLAHRSVDDPADPVPIADQDAATKTRAAQERALDRRVRALVRSLRAQGRTVVIFEPVPVTSKADDPLPCLSTSATVEACRFVASPGPLGEERAIRSAAKGDDRVVDVDLDQMACPYLPICDPVVDGQIVRRDANHLTISFATSLADPVDAQLRDAGVWRR